MNAKLRDKLRKIFNKHDPISIYAGPKINFDEYDPEIEELPFIFKRSKNSVEFLTEVHNVFIKMFDESAGPKSRYRKLAKEVYELLNKELK